MNIEGSVVGIMIPGPGADLAALAAPWGPLAFALPINLAMAIYEPLKLKESRSSPWLGFSVLELPIARRRLAKPGRAVDLPATGVYIDDVFLPSPAAAADVRIGDSLLSIDGNRITSVGTFQKWLYLSGIGRTVTLGLSRNGKPLEKRVTIEQRPAEAVPR
jgi:serine protease Do